MFKKAFRLLSFFVLILVLFVSCTQVKDESELIKLADIKGISTLSENDSSKTEDDVANDSIDDNIILNISSKKIHLNGACSSVSSMKEENKLVKPKSALEEYLENGYNICSNCNKKYGDGSK